MTSQVEKRSFFDAAFEADVWDFVWRLKKEHNSWWAQRTAGTFLWGVTELTPPGRTEAVCLCGVISCPLAAWSGHLRHHRPPPGRPQTQLCSARRCPPGSATVTVSTPTRKKTQTSAEVWGGKAAARREQQNSTTTNFGVPDFKVLRLLFPFLRGSVGLTLRLFSESCRLYLKTCLFQISSSEAHQCTLRHALC